MTTDRYATYVEHPRYGRGPRYTDLKFGPGARLNYHGSSAARIEQTAIAADPGRQCSTVGPLTHYVDLDRVCRDCGRPFLFFAEEQKHWYEELGFPLDADCVRCPPCRKREQVAARRRATYERLFHRANRSPDESFEMAAACVELVSDGVFSRHCLQRVRPLIRTIPADDTLRRNGQLETLLARLHEVERMSQPK